jgi:surfactin synthase thioesterase subunit
MAQTRVVLSSRASAAEDHAITNTLRKWCPSFTEKRKTDSIHLFCFPFAGGAASAFGKWASSFPEHIVVCPIQYPGRENRWGEPAASSLSSLVQSLANDLEGCWRERFAFLGHSFGALVAFELARTLAGRGQPTPLRLFLAGARAPHLPPKELMHELPDEGFLAKLRQYNGMPDEALENDGLIKAVLPIIRSDFRLLEQHRFQDSDRIAIPISVFGGLEDLNVSIADLLLWSSQTTKAFRSRFLKGHHFFLFNSLPAVSTYIKEDLAAAEGSSPDLSSLTETRDGDGHD